LLDERHCEREALIYHLRVFDVDTDQVVGYIDDISVDGVRLLSEQPIPAYHVHRYRLELPKHYEGKRTVEFFGVTTWTSGWPSGNDEKNDFYDCGVKFLDLDPLEKERISQLIGGFRL